MNPRDAYDRLRRECFELDLIGSTAATLGWDELTQMPPKGTAHRAEQTAFLSKLAHERQTSPRIGEMIATIEGSDLMADGDVAANVRGVRRWYDRARKLPPSLVEAMAKHAVLSQEVWVAARKASDFAAFAPSLTRAARGRRPGRQ